jgi:AmmeMemoRadiSam system protein B
LTRKPFETPFGRTRIDKDLVDELAVQPAALMEDYCHAVEHSIEFQVLFLQAIGVQQKLMRHAGIGTTMDVYGNALMKSKRDANSKVVRMALRPDPQQENVA